MTKNQILSMPLGEILKLAAKNNKPAEPAVATPIRTGVTKRTTVHAAAPTAKADVAPKVLTITACERNGKPFLALKEPGFNYKFVKGFYYNEVIKPRKDAGTWEKGGGWAWDEKAGVRYIPVEDTALLMKGLHDTYKGARLFMGDQVIEL